jgi:hypothetical protein
MDYDSRKIWFDQEDHKIAPGVITPGCQLDIGQAPGVSDELTRKAAQLAAHSEELLGQDDPQAVNMGRQLAEQAKAVEKLSLEVFRAYFGEIPKPNDVTEA